MGPSQGSECARPLKNKAAGGMESKGKAEAGSRAARAAVPSAGAEGEGNIMLICNNLN